jgi:hypothetical protein
MLGSNPSADSVASTDPGGCCAIPLSSVCRHRARIGRGTKAQNPGGAGAKPLRHSLLPLRKPASSHNACIGLISPIENLSSCLPVIVPERTGTKANSSN